MMNSLHFSVKPLDNRPKTSGAFKKKSKGKSSYSRYGVRSIIYLSISFISLLFSLHLNYTRIFHSLLYHNFELNSVLRDFSVST